MKRFTKYPCEVCGKMVSNSGLGAAAHRRGKACQAVLAERMKNERDVVKNYDYTDQVKAALGRGAEGRG